MDKIDRKIWTVESFSYKMPSPAWKCPICNVGVLNGDKNTLKIEHTQATLKARRSKKISHDYANAEFRFAGFLKCSNRSCNEKIGVVGKGELYSVHTDAVVQNTYLGERYSVYIPSYFEPPLNIFEISGACPKIIAEQIKKSFSHFFSDLSACANAIRTALELIMDDKDIPSIDDKGKIIFLGRRILKFIEANPELKALLEAVKWIGNAGSHIEGVTKDDILNGYELLMFVLEELYEREERFKSLSEKAKEITSKSKR